VLLAAVLVGAGCARKPETQKASEPARGGPAADTTYTIKFKSRPDVGKSMLITKIEKEANAFKLTDATGKVLKEDKGDELKETISTVTVLEGGDKKPKKFKEVYEKAASTKGDKTSEKSFSKRTLNYEWKDGKYEVKAEGEPALIAQELESLAAKASKPEADEVMLPKKPVKVGESWTLDPSEIAKSFDDAKLDASRIKAEAKLVKVYDKDGKKFGVIDVDLKLPMADLPGIKLDGPTYLELKMSLDTAIDGSSTAGKMTGTGKMLGKGSIDQAGMKFNVEISVNIAMDETRSAEKAGGGPAN